MTRMQQKQRCQLPRAGHKGGGGFSMSSGWFCSLWSCHDLLHTPLCPPLPVLPLSSPHPPHTHLSFSLSFSLHISPFPLSVSVSPSPLKPNHLAVRCPEDSLAPWELGSEGSRREGSRRSMGVNCRTEIKATRSPRGKCPIRKRIKPQYMS